MIYIICYLINNISNNIIMNDFLKKFQGRLESLGKDGVDGLMKNISKHLQLNTKQVTITITITTMYIINHH